MSASRIADILSSRLVLYKANLLGAPRILAVPVDFGFPSGKNELGWW